MTKRGRKSKYTELIKPRLEEIAEWYENGAIDEQVWKKLGISKDTFYKYKKRYKEFSDTIEQAKLVIDDKVENKLYQLAMGYDFTEETVTNKGNVVEIRKHKPPDFRAVSFWLKNRRPEQWRDKQDINLTGGLEFEINLLGVDNDEKDKG